MSENTRLSLLRELQESGSDEAWKQFADIYETMLTRWLSKSNLQQADIDDVRQEVLAVVFTEISGFVHNGRPGAFRRWLRQILSNRLHRLWRNKTQEQRKMYPVDVGTLAGELVDESSLSSGDWDLEYSQNMIEQILRVVKLGFSKDHVTAFKRLAIQGQNVHDVAHELKMSIGAVRVSHHRIMKALKEVAGDLLD